MKTTLLLPLFVLVVSPGSRGAETGAVAPLRAGYLHEFEADVDGGGEVSSDLFYLRAGAPLYRRDGALVALSAAYHHHSYRFSGGEGFAGGSFEPWGDIHSVRLGLPVRWEIGGRWTFFGLPSARFSGEAGADFGDSLTGAFLGGVSYRFGDRLTIGPGLGYVGQLGDDASVFPIVLVRWEIVEGLNLSTGPVAGATLGPGLAVTWDLGDRLRLSVGARYERLRFRLDDDSRTAAGGIGEDRGIPVFAALSFQASERWRLGVIGGVGFGNELSVADRGGLAIDERETDPSPFAGINLSLTF